jgi:hypothetical protein
MTRATSHSIAQEAPAMSQRGRIQLSTMEIILIGVLVGSLVLSLLQARREERQDDHEH